MSNIATQEQRPKFSAMISTPGYQKLINNTLRDEKRAQRFIAAITSAVAVNPLLQECDPPTILSGALLEYVGYWTLFPYGALFVAAAFVTMLFVRHGDNRPEARKGLEAFDVED